MAATGEFSVNARLENPCRKLLHTVAVAHPHLHRRGQVVEEGRASSGQSPARRGAVLVQGGVAKLLLEAPGHRASQLVHHRLHAVADAEHWDVSARRPNRGSERGIFFVDAGRPTGEDDALRVDALHLLPRVGGVGDLRVDLQLADAPGDEVAVLGAEIDDGDALVDLSAGRPGGLGIYALGDLEVGGDLKVVAGGNAAARWAAWK